MGPQCKSETAQVVAQGGREDELYKLFFGVHEAITMPEKIKNATLSIYKEVLSDVP